MVASGYSTEYFQIGIKSDGTLWAWGMNTNGQLGQGDTSVLNAPTQIGSDSTWSKVVCGYSHAVALKTDGTLWAWGWNNNAQCGQGHTTTPLTTPTQIGSATDWVDIASGTNSSYAKKADESWYGWGVNNVYQLGLGHNTSPQTSPALLTGSYTTLASRGACCLAIKADGTLWAWGYQTDGMMGDGANVSSLNTPTQIGSATDWLFVTCGDSHSLAIKTNGSLYASGLNSSGQLGLGDTTRRLSFTQVGSATDWVLAKGLSTASAFVNSSGQIWTTGNNTYGQLALENYTNKTAPEQSPFAEVVTDIFPSSLTFYALVGSEPPVIVPTLTTGVAHLYAITAYITGNPDSTTDYDIPLSSFSLYKRDGAASYYAITTQFSTAMIDALNDRPNGIVHIKLDNIEWETFNQSHPIRFDRGPRSASISISGTRQETITDPTTLAIDSSMVVDEGINSDGLLMLDLVPGYVNSRPGDSITWAGVTYLIELVKHRANASGQTMVINASEVA